jgi:ATP-dependent helicase HrpB
VRSPLPIDERIEAIGDSLRTCHSLVLKAPPGAGKTTRVPPALLDGGLIAAGRGITVLEPRRLAARAAAARVAGERGGPLGREVGYRVRFASAVSADTRLTYVTEGVLVRRLLADSLLEDTGAVVLDEFHERSAEADLALSLLRELQGTVRPDLLIVVMSATLDPAPIARFLGDCPVIESEGRSFEVKIVYAAGAEAGPVETRVVEAAARLFDGDPRGSVLVFLPGAAEIRRVLRLAGPMAAARGIDLCPLHGDLPPEEQDRAIRAGPRPRLVVSTNIAEASVTVEGVTGVVDSGLARASRRDPRSGLNRLTTVRISRSSAVQRAGRAGRTAPGRCVRLFTEGELAARPEFDEPEIRRIDLAEVLLAQLAWGARDPLAFSWLDPPEPAAVRRALRLLRRLGAVEDTSPDDRPVLSAIGRAMLHLPVHPRLARILVEAERRSCRAEGAVLVALLSERDIRLDSRANLDADAPGSDRGGPEGGPDRRGRGEAVTHGASDLLERRDELEAAARLRFDPGALRLAGLDPRAARRVWQTAEQLQRGSRRGGRADRPVPEDVLLRCLLAGYPDRVVRRRGAGARNGLMVGGVGARLDDASVVRDGELFVALDAAPVAGGSGRFVLVRQASMARREWLEELFPVAVREEDDVRFDEATGRVAGLRRRLFLDLALDERETGSIDPERALELLHDAARRAPARAIALEPELEGWFARVRWLLGLRPDLAEAFERAGAAEDAGRTEKAGPGPHGGAAAPPASDPVVEAAGPLFPWVLDCLRTLCAGKRSLEELRLAPLRETLRAALPGVVAAALTSLAPERVVLPSGREARLQYRPADPPVLAARLQEFLGSTGTPRVGGGRVPVLLHLLAPSHRPVQVTADLASFWANVYPKIRSELRRRYPRHAWPDDPLTAAPERGPRRRETRNG